MSQYNKLSKSSNSVEYKTPKRFFDKLNAIFKFKLDPATNIDNNLGLERYYTENDNGLQQPWNYNTFVNPPFGRGINKWINKMQLECDANPNNIYVMLLPAKTDTKWFQEQIWYDKVTERIAVIHFIKGRLKFESHESNPDNNSHISGSMLWILGSYTNSQIMLLNDLIPGITVTNDLSIYGYKL